MSVRTIHRVSSTSDPSYPGVRKKATPIAYDESIDQLVFQTAAGVNRRIASMAVTELDKYLENYVDVLISSAELLALRATPKQLVAAPGSGFMVVFHRASLVLLATATGYVESTANLGIKYTDGSGVQVNETVEATGFIDQTAKTMTAARPKLDPIVAATGCDNKALVLHNLGAGEYTTGTGTMKVRVWYSIIPTA